MFRREITKNRSRSPPLAFWDAENQATQGGKNENKKKKKFPPQKGRLFVFAPIFPTKSKTTNQRNGGK